MYSEYKSNFDKELNAAHILTSEILDCFSRFYVNDEYAFPLAPYLLTMVSMQPNPEKFTYDRLLGEELLLDSNVKYLVETYLNADLWQHLLDLTSKYSTDDFYVATIYGTAQHELKTGEPTPRSIISLAHEILDVKANELVADFCCGTGNYIFSASVREPNAIYEGYEDDIYRSEAAMMLSEMLAPKANIEYTDVFYLYGKYDSGRYDKIFSNYPFGMKLKSFDSDCLFFRGLRYDFPKISSSTSSDWIFNLLICDMLKDSGKAVAIMTNGSTRNSVDIPMRKHFVENGFIEAVISLPSKMFSFTGIPTTLIVLSKNNKSVRMIDATNLCHRGRRQCIFTDEDIRVIVDAFKKDCEYSKSISINELRENEYCLDLERYTEAKIHFNNGVSFEDIMKSITRGAPCTAEQLDEMVSKSATNMQYLMLANIQNGLIDDKLPYLSYIDPKYEKYCLKNNSLILSKNGYPYKVAVASVKENQKILANGNLYIIELDEDKVNPYYLKAFFDSEQGISVLRNITVGAKIPNIGVDKLKKVEIPLPPLEEQNRIAERYLSTLNEISSLKLKLEETIDKLQLIFNEG